MAQSKIRMIKLNNGVEMPIFGLGTYKATGSDIKQAVKDAIELGYRHFDTADYYKNLGPLGETIRESIASGKVTREEVFITTKVFSNCYGPNRVLDCVQRMKRESGLEYFDLVLLHWPFVFADDDDNLLPCDADGKVRRGTRPLLEVYKELEQVYHNKWARAIGVSNFNAAQISDLLKNASVVPTMNQVECHLYLQQKKLQAFCAQNNIHLTAYCPLGTAGTRPGAPNLLQDPVLVKIAEKHHKSAAQIALRWLVDRNIFAIPKSVHRNRLADNIDLFGFELTDDDRKALDAMDKNLRMVQFKVAGCELLPEYPFNDQF